LIDLDVNLEPLFLSFSSELGCFLATQVLESSTLLERRAHVRVFLGLWLGKPTLKESYPGEFLLRLPRLSRLYICLERDLLHEAFTQS